PVPIMIASYLVAIWIYLHSDYVRSTIFRFPTSQLARFHSRRSDREPQERKELERFRPQPTERYRGERCVNRAIEKMLERDQPASTVPNRFLGVGCAVS